MADLGPRGQALYDSLVGAITKHPDATRVLLMEAARAADRLSDLDDIVAGKGVLELLRFRLRDNDGRIAEVKFDAVMAEARQQQANFSSLMRVVLPNLDPEHGAVKGRDFLDEIAKRRAARRSGTAKTADRAKRSG